MQDVHLLYDSVANLMSHLHVSSCHHICVHVGLLLLHGCVCVAMCSDARRNVKRDVRVHALQFLDVLTRLLTAITCVAAICITVTTHQCY
jgi:TRAP-type C4-dicarboxylate transport system permease large subunit